MTTTASTSTPWEVDSAHSAAHFSVKHLMISTVRGQFKTMSGSVVLDEADLTRSSVQVEVDAASIETREPKRDAHLKSADFFDVERFPKLTFRSTRIERVGDEFKVTGDLTMHGVTRPLALSVDSLSAPTKDPYGRLVRGVSATGKLNRKDWGLGWNAPLETGGVLVGEEVKLQIDAELVAKKPA
ncbi:MAG: YceI family protein [Myxococcaceae bacterium]